MLVSDLSKVKVFGSEYTVIGAKCRDESGRGKHKCFTYLEVSSRNYFILVKMPLYTTTQGELSNITFTRPRIRPVGISFTGTVTQT